jgi:hypothetical protein
MMRIMVGTERWPMLRVTDDVLEVRRWAERHGARPCRDRESGRLMLAAPGEPCPSIEVGWDEWEPAFRWTRCVLVYDDAPGLRPRFVGDEDAARRWLAAALGRDASPPQAGHP